MAVDLERELAFAILGIAFTVALPRRPVVTLALLIASAGTLEWIQTLVPSRHGEIEDFAYKSIGAAVGVAVGVLINRLLVRAFAPAK